MARIRWFAPVVVVAGVVFGGLFVAYGPGEGPATAVGQESNSSEGGRPRVEVIAPTAGGLERTAVQPGSVHAFESANLYAKVSGYLKSQSVDIGDRVKLGQVLAVIDMPELYKEADRRAAELKQSQAQVAQMKAHVATAVADARVADANIKQYEAQVAREQATLSFADKQYNRIKSLFQLNSVDEKLVDEKEDRLAAARAAERAAQSSLLAAQALASSAQAKIEQANADLTEAEARVDVIRAELEKTKVMLNYCQIISPYNGVITARNFHPGDFIRAADQGAAEPLLNVAKTDLMRVVLQIPDDDVPFTGPGDKAMVDIDALPGRTFTGKVARVADAEDPTTRTMRTEVDLPNPNGILREGMYGRVTVVLHERPANAFTIPSSCLVGQSGEGHGFVYVVEGGRLRRKAVKIGADNGVLTEILAGLSKDDQVVVRYNGAVGDGVLADVVRNE